MTGFITRLIRPNSSEFGPGPNLDKKGLICPIHLQIKRDYAYSPFLVRRMMGSLAAHLTDNPKRLSRLIKY